LNEAIAVEARFEPDGTIYPLAFILQGRRYRIASISRQWEHDGEHRFLVMTSEEQIYVLAFLPDKRIWRLSRRPEDFKGRRKVV